MAEPVAGGVVREKGHAGVGEHAPQGGREAAVKVCKAGAGGDGFDGGGCGGESACCGAEGGGSRGG